MARNTQQQSADLEAITARMREGIESWYEKHFHRHVASGTTAISSDEKDELVKVVAAAVQPKAQEPEQASASERD